MMLLYSLNNLYYFWIWNTLVSKIFILVISSHFFFFLLLWVSICFSRALKSDLELNLLILCLQRFILSSSIQFCLNTYLCSLAQFFQKLTEFERHVPENSQRPSASPLPGNTCSGHYYKGAQLSQALSTKLARKCALPVPDT